MRGNAGAIATRLRFWSAPSTSELGRAECRTSLVLFILGMEPALLQTGRWAAPPAVSQLCESVERYAQSVQALATC